jgi:type I restriction enzyme S subunit
MKAPTNSKVQQIRFKGFEGEWEDKTLGELFPITSAARVHKNEWTTSGVPFFRSSDVVSTFKGHDNTKAFISHELYEALSAKVGRIRRGDMLVTGGGSIGIPYLAKSDAPLYFKDADLLWFKIREAVDSDFLFTFFSSQSFRRYLQSISHIGTIAHYTVEQAKATPLTIPRDATEQTQIGTYFQELDRLIGLQQRKHDKLVTLKKAMLQKMFPQPGTTTPEIRFKGFSEAWVAKRLGDVLLSHPFKPYLADSFPSGRFEVIQQGDNPIAGYASGMAFQEFEDVILFGDHTLSLYRPTKPFLVASDGIKILANRIGLFRDYLYSLLVAYMPPSEGYKRHLSILKAVCLPISLDQTEQQKIGTYFRTLDELISQNAMQLQKLKQLKSACLERMFV